jgi:uncharacterized membrane protein (DUF485 family)
MSQKIPHPTKTILGTFNERGDLLRQRAPADRPVRRVRASVRVVFVLLVLVLAPFVLARPYATIGWVGTYLVPVVVVFGLLVGMLALLAWAVLTLIKSGNKII